MDIAKNAVNGAKIATGGVKASDGAAVPHA